jgi:hypothetical protein
MKITAILCLVVGAVGPTTATEAQEEPYPFCGKDDWIRVDQSFDRYSTGFNRDCYPSADALCEDVYGGRADKCMKMANRILDRKIRCLLTKGKDYSNFLGRRRETDPIKRLKRNAKDRKVQVFAGMILLLTLSHYFYRKERKRSQVLNCILFSIFMLTFDGIRYKTTFSNFLNPNESMWVTCVESFKTFKAVHPMSSPMIAISHFATYWVAVAAFLTRSMRMMIFWWLCYFLAVSSINEAFHEGEEDGSIQCMRTSFIIHSKKYLVNDFVRADILPPFFVYFWLLPNMLVYYRMEIMHSKLFWYYLSGVLLLVVFDRFFNRKSVHAGDKKSKKE